MPGLGPRLLGPVHLPFGHCVVPFSLTHKGHQALVSGHSFTGTS